MVRARTISACHKAIAAAPASCCALTCRETVEVGRLFCANHWFFLPKWVRDAIWNTFIDGESGEYQEAVRRAADYIDGAFVEAAERFPRQDGMGAIELVSARDAQGNIERRMMRRVA